MNSIRPIEDRKIVCAANMFKDSTVIIGVRHWDMFMRKQADAFGLKGHEDHIQGFIDQFGDFWDREEALSIIKHNKQFIDPQRNSHHKTIEECIELYSEGLY